MQAGWMQRKKSKASRELRKGKDTERKMKEVKELAKPGKKKEITKREKKNLGKGEQNNKVL